MSPDLNNLLSTPAWEDLAAWLPHDLADLAESSEGFRRRRALRSPRDFVRMALAYGALDLSLRSVAAWCAEVGLGSLSDVAVLGRLRRGWPLLRAVFQTMLARHVAPLVRTQVGRRVRLLDATTLSAPGSEGADWRLHTSYDPVLGLVEAVELTDARGGERLGRLACGPGELLVADRGYAHASRMSEVLERGAELLIRIGHKGVPLQDEHGNPLDALAFAAGRRPHAGRPPRVEERRVWLQSDVGRLRPLRLIVVRKSAQAAQHERARIRRECARKGKHPTARTLRAAQYTLLLCSLPRVEATAVELAELYRVRWQIELLFKRWKSLLGLDNLRADDPDLAQAYIYAKLIAAVLVEAITRQWRAFSPYGVPLHDLPVADLAAGADGADGGDLGLRQPEEVQPARLPVATTSARRAKTA